MTAKAFIKLDSTNHVVSHRAGILQNPSPEQGEVEVPFSGFDFENYIFKLYNSNTGEFTVDSVTQSRLAQAAAAIAAAPKPPLAIPTGDFKQLFTLAERSAIKTLAQQDFLVQEFLSTLDDPTVLTVDLNSSMVGDYLNHLVSTNTITAERKTAVLANQQP
jgi:hypothetical protein